MGSLHPSHPPIALWGFFKQSACSLTLTLPVWLWHDVKKLHSHTWCLCTPHSTLTVTPYCVCAFECVFVCEKSTVLTTGPLAAGMREHPSIPISDLADYIERLKANDGLRFSQEYEVTFCFIRDFPLKQYTFQSGCNNTEMSWKEVKMLTIPN